MARGGMSGSASPWVTRVGMRSAARPALDPALGGERAGAQPDGRPACRRQRIGGHRAGRPRGSARQRVRSPGVADREPWQRSAPRSAPRDAASAAAHPRPPARRAPAGRAWRRPESTASRHDRAHPSSGPSGPPAALPRPSAPPPAAGRCRRGGRPSARRRPARPLEPP